MQTTSVGHSLGGTIANYIASSNDKAVGLDAGYTIGQSSRNNSKQYRSNGDIVSALGSNNNNMRTLKSPNIRTGIGFIDALRSHNIKNNEKEGLKI